MTHKIYVLDTSVYLTDISAVSHYNDHEILIPFKVLEELDKHKKRQDTVGFCARSTIRMFDELREYGSLFEGVSLGKEKGSIRVIQPIEPADMPAGHDPTDSDNQIIATALDIRKEYFGSDAGGDWEVILVSRDVNMRVKADGLGLQTEDFETERLVSDTSQLYTGMTELTIPDKMIEEFYDDDLYLEDLDVEKPVYTNQYFLLQGKSKSGIGRYVDDKKPLVRVTNAKKKPIFKIRARNKEQTFALDALTNPDIKLVSLVGPAGCGKTLLAIAAGLDQVLHSGEYKRMVVSRPIQPLGKDIGFLPGTLEEKMMPWIAPIYDNLQNLLGDRYEMKNHFDQGVIEIEALTYIRGRSISDAFIVVDEAQNLSSHELKTIITRVGENTKLILTGDIEQIDNVYLDEYTNGLTVAVEKFKTHALSAHVTLTKGERSALATLASKIL
jgi:PhoH-like ATPase|tara:strand:- start:1786 stop:3111 length:1326 start_codon:yes stop_codon:yes gene_type:complete